MCLLIEVRCILCALIARPHIYDQLRNTFETQEWDLQDWPIQCCGAAPGFTVLTSVVDPDPHGYGTFAWIRNYCSESGSSKT